MQEHGGLDVQTYDQDLALELFEVLKPTALGSKAGDLDSLLSGGEIGVEQFLIAFFRVVQPFSDMMSDLLRVFEKAGIKHGKVNLQVRFHFDEQTSPLDFDLKHFRQWQEEWQRVAGIFLVNLWSYDALWKLNGVVRQMDASVRDEQMQDWLNQYRGSEGQSARMSGEEPLPPKSGVAELDAAFERMWSIWLTVVRESKRHGPERKELNRLWRENRNRRQDAVAMEGEPGDGDYGPCYPSEEYRELWPLELLGMLDSDLWAASLAQGAYAKAEEIRNLQEPQQSAEARALNEKLIAIFASLGVAEVSGEWLQRSLLDFLSLPVWKQRHELYSAWIMTQILGAMRDEDAEIHSVDGRLLFEFKPTHLATFASRQPHLHLMAEVRSSLANPLGTGRKKSVQPDYSLIPSPITSPECSLMEVECKQYVKAARKKFAHALSDYARARPLAQIVLVNYGPASDGILDAVEADVRVRTRILGGMRPRSEPAQSTFARWVRESVVSSFANFGVVRTNSNPLPSQHFGMAGEIRLKWKSAPRDLDLHLTIKVGGQTTEISYTAKGDTSNDPWAQLDHDDTSGQGVETIQITKWLKASYLCAVHNYSGEAPLAESGAKLTFILGGQQFQFTCPSAGSGCWWEVFSYTPSEDKLVALDRITESLGE